MIGQNKRRMVLAEIEVALVLLAVHFAPLPGPPIDVVSAGSYWIDTTQADFEAGTLDNVVVTADGNVMLASRTLAVQDDFLDESKIAYKDKVVVNTTAGEVRLLKVPGSNETINKTYGGSELDFGWDVQQTSDGGYILAGETVSYGPGFYDAWLIKTDALGNEEWSKTYGGAQKDGARSIALTADGGYIVAGYADSFGHPVHDLWLIKTDGSGNEQWNRTYGGSSSDGCCLRPYSVHQTMDGGYAATGFVTSFGHGSYDAWLVKTDAFGNMQWNRTYGGASREDGNSFQQTPDGGFIIVGDTASFGSGGTDLWLVRTDDTGVEQWNKTFGGANDDWGASIYPTADGGYVIAGDTKSYGTGGFDFWLIKIDDLGNEEWNRTYGEPTSDDTGNCVAQTLDGGYVIVGYSIEFSGDADVWLIKTDSSGLEEWRETYAGAGNDWAFKVLQTTDGGYAFTGDTSSFGAAPSDLWFVKTMGSGNLTITGELVSVNLLAGQNASSINTFRYGAMVPVGTGIKVQFSQDNLSWFDSNGILNGWDQLSSGLNSVDLSALAWKGEAFCYRMVFSSDTEDVPMLNLISVSYRMHSGSGTLTSQPFDSGSDKAKWKTLSWNVTTPDGTSLVFRLRSADNQANLSGKPFVGLDGTPTNYSSAASIWSGHNDSRWIQYRAHFLSTGQSTPVLEDVTVYFNLPPEAPTLTAPPNDMWMVDNTPQFNWISTDSDGLQEAFQVLIDDDGGFGSIDFDSGEQTSVDEFWQFPVGTGYTVIPDGTWFWKARIRDNDGDWSPFSGSCITRIDTAEPASLVAPVVPYWQVVTPLTINATATDAGSGVANVSLWFRHSGDNSTWSNWSRHGTDSLPPWSWSFDFPDGEGFYEFYSIAVDNVGHVETKTAAEAIAAYGADVALPPSNLTAALSGNGLVDVHLLWTLSPDDGGGMDNVARYDILRGSVYDQDGAAYALYASVPAGESSFTDVGAGEGDQSNHFYQVCAVTDTGLPSCHSDQAGKFTSPLAPGPNLISIPLIQSDESVETVLQTVEYDWAWLYDSSAQEWKWHMTSKEYRSGLWTVDHTIGLWVNATVECNLTVAGVVPAQTTIHLNEGWNLLSFPSFNASFPVSDLKAETGATTVEGFDLTPPYYLRMLGDIHLLQAGCAYWVRVDADADWIVEAS
jgi:hypothetical protein